MALKKHIVSIFNPESRGDFMTFRGLHGIVSQKVEFFIKTAVRISNPV
jgi:hypothetical protein